MSTSPIDAVSRSGHPNSRFGPRPHRRRQLPDDFAERAAEMSLTNLVDLYETHRNVVHRWSKEAGVVPLRARRGHDAPPPDLGAQAKVMGMRALGRLYGVHHNIVRRWLSLAGIEAKRYDNSAPKDGHRGKGAYHRQTLAQKRHWHAGPQPHGIPARDGSMQGMAADHLRRTAATYRCDERGRARLDGEFWRHGNVLLTPDEMLERAARMGWVRS
jgi:hypothetical protein